MYLAKKMTRWCICLMKCPLFICIDILLSWLYEAFQKRCMVDWRFVIEFPIKGLILSLFSIHLTLGHLRISSFALSRKIAFEALPGNNHDNVDSTKQKRWLISHVSWRMTLPSRPQRACMGFCTAKSRTNGKDPSTSLCFIILQTAINEMNAMLW